MSHPRAVADPRWLLILSLLVAACGGTTQPPAERGRPAADGAPPAPKVVTIAINEDPPNFWDVATQVGGAGGRQLLAVVNQFLAVIDTDGNPHPRLLAELPSVERGTWRVFGDGTMETVWRLRPGVVWHDGAPFTPDDVVFSWRVNRDPEIPNANRVPADLIVEMRVPEPNTVVATWAKVYPFADRLSDRELVPVPRHLLEKTYLESKETFLLQAYWSTEYVGLGPYRIAQWQRGAFMELAAFDGYFLGRGRIDAIRVQFIPDPNTMVASLYAQAIQTVLPPGEPDFESALLVKQDWEAKGYGTALVYPMRWTFLEPQKRRNPQPPDLADSRVRRALHQAVDRAELVRGVFGEHGIVADSWIQPDSPRYQRLQDALVRYPHDARRASQLLAETGWQRAPDGALMKGTLRFALSIRGDERVAAIVGDHWKAVGAVAQYEALAPQLQRDRAARASFTGVDINTGPTSLLNVVNKFASELVPTPENQWTGLNRGGYTNPEWDVLASSIFLTLEEPRRLELERELVRVFSTDLPAMPLYFGLEVVPVGGGLSGLFPIRGTPHTGIILHTWNVHQWDIPRKPS